MRDHDIADSWRIDISGYRAADLGAETDESGLGHAVRRILATDDEGPYRGFSNTI